jgi:hypothetical protein
MTSKEFVIWLKGFATASNNYSITPKQWDDLKDKLGEVNDDSLPTLQIFPIHTSKRNKLYIYFYK